MPVARLGRNSAILICCCWRAAVQPAPARRCSGASVFHLRGERQAVNPPLVSCTRPLSLPLRLNTAAADAASAAARVDLQETKIDPEIHALVQESVGQ